MKPWKPLLLQIEAEMIMLHAMLVNEKWGEKWAFMWVTMVQIGLVSGYYARKQDFWNANPGIIKPRRTGHYTELLIDPAIRQGIDTPLVHVDVCIELWIQSLGKESSLKFTKLLKFNKPIGKLNVYEVSSRAKRQALWSFAFRWLRDYKSLMSRTNIHLRAKTSCSLGNVWSEIQFSSKWIETKANSWIRWNN